MTPLIAFVLLLGLLAGAGALMTPAWQVEPYQGRVRPQTSDTSIASSMGPTAPEGSYRTRESDIKVQLAPAVTIHAIVREPVGAPAGRPACLFIHGAGTGSAGKVYGDLASAMASAGITTLVPDKRLDTYTDFHRNYAAMADDYGRSLKVLRSWPGVDPAKTGLYAESEGTWVSSIMTARDPSLTFTILTSPPVYPGRDQMAMAVSSYLDIIGAPAGVRADIPKLLGMNFAPLGLQYADFDALPYWSKLTQPTLINFGVNDASMPVEQGARQILDQARQAGNRNVTVRYYPANHQMRVGSRLAKASLPLESHYTRNLEDWINAVAQGTKADGWTTPQLAGAQPQQTYAAPQHTSPGLVTSIGALAVLLATGPVLLLAALVGSLTLALASAIRRRKSQQTSPPRFGRGVAALLWAQAIASLLLLAAVLGYIAIIGAHALRLEALTTTQVRLWTGLKALALVTTALSALLPARAIKAWMTRRAPAGSRAEAIQAGAFHARPQATSAAKGRPALARGWGHWIVLTLAWLGALACLLVLAFWGAYTF
ncbi:alpha/beta hydrolase family protein [Bifidobacterium actinocoloniiforme]|uniref:alpha/beta hydrolase family protein n=1 Tax=Bifidobacterium actinocoloniiforme TaxID=638619 RepID=UPI000A7350D7|nr:alpha/beta hydrolase [Bifidobacterium actinocoloniiforme]